MTFDLRRFGILTEYNNIYIYTIIYIIIYIYICIYRTARLLVSVGPNAVARLPRATAGSVEDGSSAIVDGGGCDETANTTERTLNTGGTAMTVAKRTIQLGAEDKVA